MAVKIKTTWSCHSCGHQQLKWAGQCPQCHEWNSLTEEVDEDSVQKRYAAETVKVNRPVPVQEVSHTPTPRLATRISEFDRLIGGGIVPGSFTLIGGDPGIGKSTLMLQLSYALAHQGLTVLYVCGEESVEQTSLRAKRLGIKSDRLLLFSETRFSHIQRQIDAIQPDLLIVDSIQIVYKEEIPSAPGSVAQVRENATEFMHIAKRQNIATFLIGHVTKTGEIAGPRLLEHLVDTVLYFEGDKQQHYRLIRVVKNRFGPTDEVSVFQMSATGLTEVPNPSQIFLEERTKERIGSVIIPTLEGSRPILIEAQALVTETAFSTPTRRCTGLDQNRLALLLAVLEKKMGYQLHRSDVFVSVAGGLRIKEPATDLGLLLAITSSFFNRVIDSDTAIVGEVGLGGEVRTVSRITSRVKEVCQMGFKTFLIPKRNVKGVQKELTSKVQLIGVDNVEEAVKALIH